MHIVFLASCSSARRRRGSRRAKRNRRSQSVHADSGGGEHPLRSLSLAPSVFIEGHISRAQAGEQDDISIRGARHDRIAAHKLKTLLRKGAASLQNNENRSTRDERVQTKTLCLIS